MNFPADLKYTEDHEWIKVLDGSIALVGITDYAQGELGELVYVEVETVGETLEKNEVFGTVEAVKTTSDLFLPVAGKIIEFNSKISSEGDDDPTVINSDPYGDGWIIKMEVNDLADLEPLMDADAYKTSVE